MITLRTKSGDSLDINANDLPYVEIRNDFDGTIIRLFIQAEPGKLIEVFPGTDDAGRYEALMSKQRVKFATTIINRK